jgi:hypothetical protein
MEDAMPAAKGKVKKAAKKPAPKTVKKTRPEDVWAAIWETQETLRKATEEREKEREEREKAWKKAEERMEDLDRIMGRLGNKFGDIAEYTLVPSLPEKFKKYQFTFQVINRNRKINDDEHDIHVEIDAFLENGREAMAVEVKVTLRPGDVDDHIRRMEKLRKHADLRGDKRQLYGAIAAMVVADEARLYASRQGFYVIEPAGEDVKITPPVVREKFW